MAQSVLESAAVPPRTSPLVEILESARAAFIHDGIPDLDTRLDRLTRLGAMITDCCDELAVAVDQDFGTRPRYLTMTGDIGAVLLEIAELRQQLPKWMKTERPHRWRRIVGLDQSVRYDPLGVIGIAAPWNFPIQLSLTPTAGALAAGNRVMLRPSSMTQRTSAVLARHVPHYFEPEEFTIATRADGPGAAFSKLDFDGFFFTGSPEVGREVARDCAANLTPVTLELGGKNPAIVDRDADPRTAADRIARSRLTNSGQVCLCPDYVFVPQENLDEFVAEVLATWQSMFPAIAENDDYTSIIDDDAYRRILGLISDARDHGAHVEQLIPPRELLPDPSSRKIPPTVVTRLTSAMELERQEVFGPVLSVYGYNDLAEAIDHVNAHDHALTLYWFGPKNARFEHVVDRTRSGSVNVNDFLLNMAPGTPFGGVGASGYGSYHGEYSYRTFSNARTVAGSAMPLSSARTISPPYSRTATTAATRGVYASRRLFR
ncbi:putative aldehyde dehydrogenase [Gordonia effusa NBRC 100432]|uniref:Aldehyde dehydrogenase n=1 Tax=Gordonia effusa NBRC 100432 TaxID=1077974 RepID=H0QWF4_9ACTN|nr:aldehyde dehydrogenase family protein [Gordonia effusa]GAB17155.1 putative aldehyde dehydrogenase [Gordonia effusa NBRC 100432]